METARLAVHDGRCNGRDAFGLTARGRARILQQQKLAATTSRAGPMDIENQHLALAAEVPAVGSSLRAV
eukprot:157501-Pyramimonas_sp.AAC.1